MLRIEVNGTPATVDDVHRVAVVNYGHFTSLQVRNGAARGVGLHCDRLDGASQELFGQPVDGARVRALIRHALATVSHASVRVNIFSKADASQAREGIPEPSVMVTVSELVPEDSQPPWRLMTMAYERGLPHIKHVATMGLIRRRKKAQASGYDDVLFVEASGQVSEGSTWNIAFWDGEAVITPDAAKLDGVTIRLMAAALTQIGVPVLARPVQHSDLREFKAAFATYSVCCNQPIASIDQVQLRDDQRLRDILDTARSAIPWEKI
jgi:4-amino-4-deoxychorismate lyase